LPEISDDELKEYRGLQSRVVGLELDGAKDRFRAENPHVPAGLVSAYQGDPAGLADFGKVLLEQFPKPAPASAPATPETPPTQAPAPATPPLQAPPAQAPTTPLMATQFPIPMSAEAQRQQYLQQTVNGNAQIPGTVPAPAPVPSPGSADALTQQNAVTAESQRIRDLMRIGRATLTEVQWLSQWGEHGFTAAMTSHARKVASVVGR
jgi:hypothetical protein